MLKGIFILLAALSVHTICGLEKSNRLSKAEEEPKLGDKPYGIAGAIKSTREFIEGQRQKRFYDYSYVGYNSGSSAFSSVIPTYPSYASSGSYHSTNAPNEQSRLNEILRRLQRIADLSRVFDVSPPSYRRPQLPLFIPIHTFSPGCTCPPTNTNPPNTPSDAQTTQKPPATYLPPTTKEIGKGTTQLPDFGNRSGEGTKNATNPDVSDDYDDGVRPINFDPVPPKGPQNVVPPPVEHGSFQAGLDPTAPELAIPPAAQTSDGASQSAPTVCDAAILICCHKPLATADCFAKEGCGELEYEDPCLPKVLLNIGNKVRTHLKRRGD